MNKLTLVSLLFLPALLLGASCSSEQSYIPETEVETNRLPNFLYTQKVGQETTVYAYNTKSGDSKELIQVRNAFEYQRSSPNPFLGNLPSVNYSAARNELSLITSQGLSLVSLNDGSVTDIISQVVTNKVPPDFEGPPDWSNSIVKGAYTFINPTYSPDGAFLFFGRGYYEWTQNFILDFSDGEVERLPHQEFDYLTPDIRWRKEDNAIVGVQGDEYYKGGLFFAPGSSFDQGKDILQIDNQNSSSTEKIYPQENAFFLGSDRIVYSYSDSELSAVEKIFFLASVKTDGSDQILYTQSPETLRVDAVQGSNVIYSTGDDKKTYFLLNVDNLATTPLFDDSNILYHVESFFTDDLLVVQRFDSTTEQVHLLFYSLDQQEFLDSPDIVTEAGIFSFLGEIDLQVIEAALPVVMPETATPQVDTSTWQSFTDSVTGIKVSFPEDWVLDKEDSTWGSFRVGLTNFTVELYSVDNKTKIEDWYSNFFKDNPDQLERSKSGTLIDGHDALEVDGDSAYEKEFFAANGEYVFKIKFGTERVQHQAIYQAILDSIQFVPPQSIKGVSQKSEDNILAKPIISQTVGNQAVYSIAALNVLQPDDSSKTESYVLTKVDTGQQFLFPLNLFKEFYRFETNRVVLTVPEDPDTVLLSTTTFPDTDDLSTCTNKVFSYQVKTGVLANFYDVESTKDSPTNSENCTKIRIIGVEGSKLIFFQVDADDLWLTCSNPWVEHHADLRFLDLANIQGGLQKFFSPAPFREKQGKIYNKCVQDHKVK